MDETLDKLKEIIANQLCINQDTINDDDDIMDDLSASSLDVIEIVVTIEQTFGISVTDAQIIENRHVIEAAELIDSLL